MRKAFISPTKYVQGENELLNLGYFISTFGKSALLIAHKDDVARVQKQLDETQKTFDVDIMVSTFNGECTREEIKRLQEEANVKHSDCIVGLGGGKAIDTAKCVAEGDALIIVPTIAATDAPTSHSAVMYFADGTFDDYAYFKQSPSVVLVDTTIIAKAPKRFLAAGIGDALSTYFEARANSYSYANINAGLPCGVREGKTAGAKPTIAAQTLAEKCYDVILEDGAQAMIACENGVVTPALENVIEANILLSGLGFESAGLAAIHAVHDGLTALEPTHHYYHGEKVAFSVIVQLVLEGAEAAEIDEVMAFSSTIGLPICLEDIGVKTISWQEAMDVAEKACIPEESIHSMPFDISVEAVASAIIAADKIGRAFKESL
ncbi:glycerol dehydrogenase [Erysipelothrix inopinata]|uniref:Glycerol dehydrogenase n=1 Tax=Erysipelothrix inopinata TaxID=225084 RepID=A0A7G9RY81_9FIRM|nr:glycerol dehydrogenase [Erysipelothrix inopinata]QNN60556.1 glycerol dehydrogenase [Erysipelothrix inopinata]